MTEHKDDERFVARIAGVLREPEIFDAEFERRVMTDVTAAPLTHQSWWMRRRSVALSPMRAVAMAAGFAAMVVLGTLGVTRSLERAPGVAAATAPDTVHLVRFVLVAPEASQVSLVGDFNGWNREATPLALTSEGNVWSVSLPVAIGRHEYAFVVDGDRWTPDPTAVRHVDEYGTESSVLRVGSDALRGV